LGVSGEKEIAADRRSEIARVCQRQIQRAFVTNALGGSVGLIAIDDSKLFLVYLKCSGDSRGYALGGGRIAEIEDCNACLSFSILRRGIQRQCANQKSNVNRNTQDDSRRDNTQLLIQKRFKLSIPQRFAVSRHGKANKHLPSLPAENKHDAIHSHAEVLAPLR